MSRLVEHAQHDLLEGEDYLDNPSLRQQFDAAILVGSQGWPRMSSVLKCLKIEENSTLIIVGGKGDACTECDRLNYAPPNKNMAKLSMFLLLRGDSSLVNDKMLICTAACILNILLMWGRQEVVLSGEKDNLLKVVKCLRYLVLEDHDRYGRMNFYAVPLLPQEVE